MDRRQLATRLVKYGVCAVLLPVALDAVPEAVAPTGGALTCPVEVRSPAALFARLDYLSRFDGFKVAVLGDSIVHGRSLEDHGDPEWCRTTSTTFTSTATATTSWLSACGRPSSGSRPSDTSPDRILHAVRHETQTRLMVTSMLPRVAFEYGQI
jgi:hypothetical protein